MYHEGVKEKHRYCNREFLGEFLLIKDAAWPLKERIYLSTTYNWFIERGSQSSEVKTMSLDKLLRTR